MLISSQKETNHSTRSQLGLMQKQKYVIRVHSATSTSKHSLFHYKQNSVISDGRRKAKLSNHPWLFLKSVFEILEMRNDSYHFKCWLFNVYSISALKNSPSNPWKHTEVRKQTFVSLQINILNEVVWGHRGFGFMWWPMIEMPFYNIIISEKYLSFHFPIQPPSGPCLVGTRVLSESIDFIWWRCRFTDKSCQKYHIFM